MMEEFEEYETVIKEFFKSSFFPLLRIARTVNTRFMRESWIEESFDGKLPRKQLDLIIRYLSDDKILDSFIDIYDERSQEERDLQIERCAYLFARGISIH